MNYFLLLLTFGLLEVCFVAKAQDSIVTSDGKSIKAKLLQINKKDVRYKVYDDPEFSTYTLLEKEISTITTEKGKKYIFNHKLPRAFISINFDVYQPLGDFGRTDFNEGEPGFAIIGLGGHLRAGFYFAKRLGLQLCVGASGNRIDTEAYKEYYKDPSNPAEVIYINYDVQSGTQHYETWNFSYAAIGPMYSYKLAQWLTLDARLQVGITNVNKPSLNLTSYDSTSIDFNPAIGMPNYVIYSRPNDGQIFPTYGGGLSFRISPGRRIGFMISADYMHTDGTLKFKEFLGGGNSGYIGEEDYVDVERAYNINQIKLSVGIAYQFKRKNR
jgi:hypothetical protein